MIKSKNKPIPRPRRSGKTVCTTLAAAGLFSLAVAVTPAFAQSLIPNTTQGGTYNQGTNIGGVTATQSTSGPGNSGSNITVNLNGDTNIDGNLSFGTNYYIDTDPSGSSGYRDITINLGSGEKNISGNVNNTSPSTNATTTLNLASGLELTVDGVLGGSISNINATGAGGNVVLNIGAGINQTVNGAVKGLEIGANTTGLNNVTVSSANGQNAWISTRTNAGGNLNFGVNAGQGTPTIVVGNNQFDIYTNDGNVTFGQQLTNTNVQLGGSTGNLNIRAGGTGNIALNAGANLSAFGYTGKITIDADNAFSTGAATTIQTSGAIEIDAETATMGANTSLAGTSVRLVTDGDINQTGSFTETGTTNAQLISNNGSITVTGGSASVSAIAAGSTAQLSAKGDVTVDNNIIVQGQGDSIINSTTGQLRGNSITAGIASSTGLSTINAGGSDGSGNSIIANSGIMAQGGSADIDAAGNISTNSGNIIAIARTGNAAIDASGAITATASAISVSATTANKTASVSAAGAVSARDGITVAGGGGTGSGSLKGASIAVTGAGNGISVSGGSNGASVTATAGGITTNNGDLRVTSTGGTALVSSNAALSLGTANAIISGAQARINVLGDITGGTITETGTNYAEVVASQGGKIDLSGDLSVTSTNGIAKVSADSSIEVDGTTGIAVKGGTAATVTTGNGSITTTAGGILVEGTGANAGATLTAGGTGSDISSAADITVKGTGNGAVDVKAGASITAAGALTVTGENGNVTVNADGGDLEVGGAMTVTSLAGDIDIDGDNKISVTELTMVESATGKIDVYAGLGGLNFGDDAEFKTTAGTKNVQVGTAGAIDADGHLTVTSFGGQAKLAGDKGITTNTAGKNISVTGATSAEISSSQGAIKSGGNILVEGTGTNASATLTAGGTGSDIDSAADITVKGTGNGAVDVRAGASITAAGALTVTGQNGNVTVNADGGDLEVGGAMTVTSLAGDIDIDGDNKISVTGLTAVESATGQIDVYAGLGGLNFGADAEFKTTAGTKNVQVGTAGAIDADGHLTVASFGGQAKLTGDRGITTNTAGKNISVTGATLAEIASSQGAIKSAGNIQAEVTTAGNATIAAKTNVTASSATVGGIIARAKGATGVASVTAETGYIDAGKNTSDPTNLNKGLVLSSEGGYREKAGDDLLGVVVTAGGDNNGTSIKVAGLTDISSTGGGNVQISGSKDIQFDDEVKIRVKDSGTDLANTSIISENGNITFTKGASGAKAFDYEGEDGDLLISANNGGISFKGDNSILQDGDGSVSIRANNGGDILFQNENNIKLTGDGDVSITTNDGGNITFTESNKIELEGIGDVTITTDKGGNITFKDKNEIIVTSGNVLINASDGQVIFDGESVITTPDAIKMQSEDDWLFANKQNYNSLTDKNTLVQSIEGNVTYEAGLAFNGNEGNFDIRAEYKDKEITFSDAPVTIDFTAFAGDKDGNLTVRSDGGITTSQTVIEIKQSTTPTSPGDKSGEAYFYTTNGPINFGKGTTSLFAAQDDVSLYREATVGDLNIVTGSSDKAGDITFAGAYINTATTGNAVVYAKAGNILHNDTVDNTGGQFSAVVGSLGNTITYEKDLSIAIFDDAANDDKGAYIRSLDGDIVFNSVAGAGDRGFSFTGGRNGDLIILASNKPDINADPDEPVSSNPFPEVIDQESGVGGHITFHEGTTIDFVGTGHTIFATGQGDIRFGLTGASADASFSYQGGGGNLYALSDEGHIVFHQDAKTIFNDGAGTSYTGDTLLHAYQGNVLSFGKYEHDGGSGDFRAMALANSPYGYIRFADFSAAPGGSYLFAADKNIDLNVNQYGNTIGSYGPGMSFDFSGPGSGGLSIVSGGVTTIYNSLSYKGTGNATPGLLGSATDVSDQAIVLRDLAIPILNSTDPADKDKKTELMHLAKEMGFAWDSATLLDDLKAAIQEKGLFLYNAERLYLGKDFDLTMNAQNGYVQARSVVTRGGTSFDTSGADSQLEVYTDNWNIMGGLGIKGNNLTVASVTEDLAGRNKPVLTLQGRTDLYDNGLTGPDHDATDQSWAPNLFAGNDYTSTGTWVDTLPPTNTEPGATGSPYLNSQPNNLVTFANDVVGDPLGIFRNIVSAASTNSFTKDDGAANTTNNAFLRADVLTSLGVEVFTGDTDTSGQIRMVSTGTVTRDANGDPISVDKKGTLESIGTNLVDGTMDNASAGMYAARWNLGEHTYGQAAISDSSLAKIFADTRVWVDELDINGEPTKPGIDGTDIYGDDQIDISASQPGAHAKHNGFIGLGTEGNASYSYIQDGLIMEDGVDSLGYWKEGGTDSGIISYQALQSKIVFDQENAAKNGLVVKDNTKMNLAKTDFYGWMNVRDARTVMAASMYNEDAHDSQFDQYVLNGQTARHNGTLGYGADKDHNDLNIDNNNGIVWLESTGGLKLSEISGLTNLEKDAYNPFPDSPFFNLEIGYLDAGQTKFGLKDFSRKSNRSGVLANLSNQAPSAHAGMAWVIENAQAFDSLDVPAYAYYNFEQDGADAKYNNTEVSYTDPVTNVLDGKLRDHNGNILDPNDATDAQYIKEHIKFVELDDREYQLADPNYTYVYDRHHSVENILYLSPTRAQYNRDLTQISSGGNLDAVRMVNFNTMNDVFKMMAHRSVQRNFGLSGGAASNGDCPPGSGLWGVANYSRTEVDGNFSRGYAGFDIDRYGATIGYDHQVIDEKLLMGAYFSYSRPELDGWGRDIKADDIQFGLYAQVALPYDFIINAGLSYGWQQYDLDRDIYIGREFQNNLPIGFGEKLSADYNGHSFQFNLELAKYFYFDNGVYLRPSVQYDFNRVDIDSYTEHSKRRWNLAGDAMEMIPSVGQHISDTDFDQHIFRLGSSIGWINEDRSFEVAAKAYWVHNGGDREATGRASFNAVNAFGQGAFNISGAAYDRNQFNYGLDLKFNPKDFDWSFTVGFEGLTGDKEDVYSGTAGVLYQF